MATKKPQDFLSIAKAGSPSEVVVIPSTGQRVHARALSAAAVRKITAAALRPGKKPTDGDDAFDEDALTTAIIAASITDAHGERLVPEGREAELADLPNALYLQLQAAALRVNGMGESEKKD